MATLAKRTQREWRRAFRKARDRSAGLKAGLSRMAMPWIPVTSCNPFRLTIGTAPCRSVMAML